MDNIAKAVVSTPSSVTNTQHEILASKQLAMQPALDVNLLDNSQRTYSNLMNMESRGNDVSEAPMAGLGLHLKGDSKLNAVENAQKSFMNEA